MSIHDFFIADHQALREKAAALRSASASESGDLSVCFPEFQKAVRDHFRREDSFYRVLDDGKRIDNRGLMHQMRNDHAAVIFTLESLAIRLRKNGLTPEWRQRLETLLGVLLPHFDEEEKTLFPKSKTILTPAEFQALEQELSIS